MCLISEFVSLGEQMLTIITFSKYIFVQVLKFVLLMCESSPYVFFYLKSWMYQFMVFWTPLRIYNMCPVINSSVMKDMLLIYLIIFQYNHACTCTAIILVYVLYQYYLTLPYLILYTRLIADFVCYMNVFIFRKLFSPLFTLFLKWIRVFWIEKKLHKWYLYFSFTYFFPRIYILIWCHV